MDVTTGLSTIVGLLIALSVATERLVEIIKGIVPFLNEQHDNPTRESWRKAVLQAIAIVAGIITALLARPAISDIVSGPWNTFPGLIALGLLASGGSGFWNSVLTYVLMVKDIKKLDWQEQKNK